MKIWARTTYIVALLIVATLPFNPVLNRRFVVFPLSVACVAIGIVAMYIYTLPDKPRSRSQRRYTLIFWTVIILGIYLFLILFIGFYSSHGSGKSAESFFVANRSLNWLQESMAVFTAIAPAGALMGTIGLFYQDGANMLGISSATHS